VFTSAILARGKDGGNRGLRIQSGAFQESGQFPVDRLEPGLAASLPGHQNQLASPRTEAALPEPVRFTEKPLGAVPANGVPDPAAGDETGPKWKAGKAQREENQETAGVRRSLAIDALEFRIAPEPVPGAEPPVRRPPRDPVGGHYGASRALPLARRRFRIRRPALDFIRARKPCFFLRLRLCGWKVRFTLNPL